jgi:hypothetical protein
VFSLLSSLIFNQEYQPCFLRANRKVQKRSHTLRYVLKNRKTDTVLFVVLFTLYLKEDVDENGNVKDGVEGGKPFEMMPKEQAEKHEREKNGIAGHGVKEESEKLPDTSEDDVD